MKNSDVVKSWRIAGDFYLAKDDKVRINRNGTCGGGSQGCKR